MHAATTGTVVGLFVKPETPGERGLPKRPVPRIEIENDGVAGDFNRWRREERHGDSDLALLLMGADTLAELNREGWPVQPGDLGENVLVRGISYADLGSGRPWRVGGSVIGVTKPCDPCDNLGLLPYVGRARSPEFVRTMIGRRGWYARVVSPGPVRVGDPVEPAQTTHVTTAPEA